MTASARPVAPSVLATTTRPSVPRTARPSSVPRRGRTIVEGGADGQLRLGRQPRAPRSSPGAQDRERRIDGSGEDAPAADPRDRSVENAAGAGRSAVARGRHGRLTAWPAAWRIEVQAELEPTPLAQQRGTPSRGARPATWAAGTGPDRSASRSMSPGARASSPSTAGSRSTRVRNSYSRNSRMTSDRSYWPSFAAAMSSCDRRVPVDGHQPRHSNTSSLLATSFSRSLSGLTSSTRSNTPSSEP